MKHYAWAIVAIAGLIALHRWGVACGIAHDVALAADAGVIP